MTDVLLSRRDLLMKTWASVVIGLGAAPAVADNPSGSSNGWHQLSARDKGFRIFSAALADNGRTGGQCKRWIQKVISRASGGHVDIPPNTATTTHRWKADASGHIVDLGASISKARTGDIVQMVIRDRSGNPIGHTAIVGTVSGGKVTWLESNYRGDERVTSNRVETYQKFASSLVNGKYTVYRVR